MEKTFLRLLLVGTLLIPSLRGDQQSSVTTKEKESDGLPPNRISERLSVQAHNEGLALVLAADTPEIGLAASKGDMTTLRHLISSGVSIESAGKDRRTPLLLACGGHIAAVSVLLAAGANVNAPDATGATPLHWATQGREENIVFLLLSHRAKVNVQDEFGITPLMWAAITGNKKEVEALLAAGAKRDLTDADGLTASDWAKKNGFSDIAALVAPR